MTQRTTRPEEPRRQRSMRVRIVVEVTDFEWTLIQALSFEPSQTQKSISTSRPPTLPPNS